MPIGSIIMGAAQALGSYAGGQRVATEGSGSYDLDTGQFYDPKKVERMSIIGSYIAPHKILTDKNLTTGEKLAMFFTPGISTIIGSKRRRERMEAEQAADAARYQEIKDKVNQLPEYQMAPEAQEKLALLQETSKDVSALGQEVTDIASSRLSSESPEAAIDRKLIANNNAEMLQVIQESGAGAGAIVGAGKQTLSEYSGLSKKNLAYRMQAEQDLMSAKNNQAQLEMSGAQMEAEGLSGIIGEKGKVYQSSLNKALTGIEMDLARLTGQQMNQIQNMQGIQQANSAAASGLMQIAGSYLNNINMKEKYQSNNK